jgi:malonate transporter and related proteins
MIQVLNLAMPFFGLIALGFFTARFKAWRGTPIPEAGLGWMNFFLIYIALPALFFRILAKTPLEKLNNVPFVAGTTLATYTVFALGFAYVMIRSKGHMRHATVAGVCAAYGNIGYMGPGLAFSTIGPDAAVPVALIFCFDNILLFSLVPLLMALAGTERRSIISVVVEVVKKIFTHPFIIATVAGVISAFVKFDPPEMLDRLLAFLQSAAAPVALFTLGVTVALRMESFAALARVAASISPILALKLIVHPVLVVVILSALHGCADGLPAAGPQRLHHCPAVRHLGRGSVECGAPWNRHLRGDAHQRPLSREERDAADQPVLTVRPHPPGSLASAVVPPGSATGPRA